MGWTGLDWAASSGLDLVGLADSGLDLAVLGWFVLGFIGVHGLGLFWVGAASGLGTCDNMQTAIDRYHRHLLGCSVARTISAVVSYSNEPR